MDNGILDLDDDKPSTKVCIKCEKEKLLQEFEIHACGGIRNVCILCDKTRRKAYYEKNKDKILVRNRDYRKHYYVTHRESILAKERVKSGGKARGTFVPYMPKVIGPPKQQAIFLYIDDQQIMFDNCRHRDKRHQKQAFAPWTTGFICQDCLDREKQTHELKKVQKVKINLRHRLKKIVKILRTEKEVTICKRSDMLGCSATELKHHIEKQFKLGMSWDNYGCEWHIDHIRPCASFDLTKVEEQIKMNQYTNLQPLWAIDNLFKSDTYETNTLTNTL